jgi:anti-anti-sigma factor
MLRATLTHRFRVQEVDGLTVIQLLDPGIRDEAAIQGLGRDLTRLLGQCRHRLLLDFAVVESLSSAFLKVLLELHQRAEEAGGWLAVCGLRPGIAEAVTLTGLDRRLAMYASRPQAQAALGKAAAP